MAEILNDILVVALTLAVIVGVFYALFLLIKSKYRNAIKWSDCRRWARSQGYALPKKSNPILTIIGVVIGFFIFIVPGLIILYMAWRKDQEYEKEMRALMNKWIDAGKPLPPAKK